VSLRAAAQGQQPPDAVGTESAPAAYTTEVPILESVLRDLEFRDLRTNGPIAIAAPGAYRLIRMTDVSALAAVLAPRRVARA
jgi:hypothetical protein